MRMEDLKLLELKSCWIKEDVEGDDHLIEAGTRGCALDLLSSKDKKSFGFAVEFFDPFGNTLDVLFLEFEKLRFQMHPSFLVDMRVELLKDFENLKSGSQGVSFTYDQKQDSMYCKFYSENLEESWIKLVPMSYLYFQGI